MGRWRLPGEAVATGGGQRVSASKSAGNTNEDRESEKCARKLVGWKTGPP